MKQFCLFLSLFIFGIFLFFPSHVLAQYQGCTNFEPCESLDCPGGVGHYGTSCCQSCGSPEVCADFGDCVAPPSCNSGNPCTGNPDCGIECGSIACVNGSCVSNCYPCVGGPTPTPVPTTPPVTPPPNPNNPPSCYINGPSTLQVGEQGAWTGVSHVDGGGAHTIIQRNTSKAVSSATTLNDSYCGGSDNCATIGSWTPTTANIGLHYIYCRGINGAGSGTRECRPFDYLGAPSNLDCDDGLTSACNGTGTDCIPVTVTNFGPWVQVKGGDVHGNGNVGTQVPSSCTGSCKPYFVME